jgi:hypothetical protein
LDIRCGRILTVVDIDAFLRPRECNVKFAGILFQEFGVVFVVDVGDTAIDDIKHDDIVKLQTLGFVDRRDEDTLLNRRGATEICLLKGTNFHDVVVELFLERWLLIGMDDIFGQKTEDIAYLLYRLDPFAVK